jgi:hypothetical protein
VASPAGIDQSLVKKYEEYANIAEHLDINHLNAPDISPDLYQRNASFTESTRALLNFTHQ